MLKKRIICSILMICLVLIFSTSGQVKSLDYPEKPIKMIVPWGAGGGSDVFVRILATGAQKYLGQPMVIINRGGAGGTIATTEFLKEKPDGYSLIFEAVGVFTTQPKLRDVSYSIDDFEPVIGTSVDSLLLVTNKDTGITSFEQFKEYAKNNSVNFGFTGVGSLWDVGFGAVFNQMGITANKVTFSGGGELISQLLGNHVQFVGLHPTNIKANEESGSFVPLMVLSSERISDFPDVPCAKELGFDFEFEVWKFILAPKGTPQEIIDFLYEGFNNIMKDPKINDILRKNGVTFLKNNTPDIVLKKLLNNIEVTGKVLDKLGLSVN